MMLDTHRSKRNEHAQSTRRANHPRVGRGVLRSKVEGSSKIFLLLLARVLLQRLAKPHSGWPLNCSPQTGVWGRAPISSALCAALLNSLGADHHQVEFLGSDPSGLESPQIDDQLPTDGNDGFFLQGRIRAPQDFL